MLFSPVLRWTWWATQQWLPQPQKWRAAQEGLPRRSQQLNVCSNNADSKASIEEFEARHSSKYTKIYFLPPQKKHNAAQVQKQIA
jgi:hypothetical protein